jgi:hypothetical protein
MMSAADPAIRPIRSRLDPHLTRIATGLWVALGLATIASALMLHGLPRHTSEGFAIFMQAGQNWLNAESLYHPGDGLRAFRNSPLIAAAFAPLSLLKPPSASAILRFTSFFVVAAGLLMLVNAFVAPVSRRLARPWIFLLAIVLCFQPLGDVQTNGLSAGLIAMGVALTQRRRFWLAAAMLVLAVHIKAYPIAILMLLIALEPRGMALPTLVAVAVGLAVTFLFQRPDYVYEQWGAWMREGLNNRQGPGGENVFRDVRVLLRVFHISISPNAYLALEAITGVAIFFWMRWIRRFLAPVQVLLVTYILATAWMTVFGPATESQTYVHFAPACAMAVWFFTRSAGCDRGERPALSICGTLALTGWLLLAITQIALWFPRGSSLHLYGLHAAGGLLVVIATMLWSTARAPEEQFA